MTTPADVEAIAEVMCSAICEGDAPVAIPDADNPRHRIAACYAHQRAAEALLTSPALATLRAHERANALREAGEAWDDLTPDAPKPGIVAKWLHDRADRQEPQ